MYIIGFGLLFIGLIIVAILKFGVEITLKINRDEKGEYNED